MFSYLLSIFFDSLSCFICLRIKNEHIDYFVIMQKRRKMLEYNTPIDL